MAAAAAVAAALLLLGCSERHQSAPTDASERPNLQAFDLSKEEVEREETWPEFTLSATGITAVQAVAGRGTATTLRLGDRQADVTAALAELLREPDISANADCGAGPMEFADFGPLRANFQSGRFVGWEARVHPGFSTTDGLGPGAPYADIARDHGAERDGSSTLGDEFILPAPDGRSMGGFVRADGRVESLYAGVTCFFR